MNTRELTDAFFFYRLDLWAGGACILAFVFCVAVAVVVIINSGGKGRWWTP